VALIGYFDESGEHWDGKLRRLTLGGFFARGENVRELCEGWREALDAEHLAEFHMKETYSDEHDYANWGPERRRGFDRFVDLLGSCALQFGAFSYAVVPNRKKAFKDTYESALSKVLIVASTLAEATGEKVRLVFARTDEIRYGRIGEYFDGLSWGDYLEDYRVARARSEPALQAAEIVARGLKRIMEDGTVPVSFVKLLATGKPVRFWPDDPVAASALERAMRVQPLEGRPS
jgi:hypothetical protein